MSLGHFDTAVHNLHIRRPSLTIVTPIHPVNCTHSRTFHTRVPNTNPPRGRAPTQWSSSYLTVSIVRPSIYKQAHIRRSQTVKRTSHIRSRSPLWTHLYPRPVPHSPRGVIAIRLAVCTYDDRRRRPAIRGHGPHVAALTACVVDDGRSGIRGTAAFRPTNGDVYEPTYTANGIRRPTRIVARYTNETG